MNPENVGRIVAGIALILACISSFIQIREHALRNKSPHARKLVIRIIGMVPIYSTESYIGLCYPDLYIYCDTIRDFYEALVIYSFYQLLVNGLLQGERKIISGLENLPKQDHLAPFCCLNTWAMGHEFLRKTKLGILQYVPVKLIMSIVTYLLWGNNLYEDGSFNFKRGYVYVSLITNVSQTWAIYCLVLFYLGTKHQLVKFNPIPKFLCIKLVVFATFWQSVLLAILVKIGWIRAAPEIGYSEDNIATSLQDFLICLEMVLASVGHWIAFPVEDFNQLVEISPTKENKGLLGSRTLWICSQATDFSDVLSDVQRDFVDRPVAWAAMSTPLRLVPSIRSRYEVRPEYQEIATELTTIPSDEVPLHPESPKEQSKKPEKKKPKEKKKTKEKIVKAI